MGSEDCAEPLPQGWILQRNAKGEYAFNVETGQKFHTKKDLLRYVHYVETRLSLSKDNNNFKAHLSDETERESDEASQVGESNEQEAPDDEEEAPDDDEFNCEVTFDDEEFSLEKALAEYEGHSYKGSDKEGTSKAFADYEGSSCKVSDKEGTSVQPFADNTLDPITVSNAQNIEKEAHDGKKLVDAQNTASNMVNDTQKDQPRGKEIKTRGQRKRRNEPRKKFNMPPKQFRGWESLRKYPPPIHKMD
ncbi:hypothetical protein AAG906_005120 [Vitis piasezkii]